MSLDHFRIPLDSTGARVRTQRTLDLNYVAAKSVVKRDIVRDPLVALFGGIPCVIGSPNKCATDKAEDEAESRCFWVRNDMYLDQENEDT